MIFDRDNNGAQELRRLTGSYYANNDFSKIRGQIALATDELCDVIGTAVYDRAKRLYQEAADDELIHKVQQPIAILATLRLYQRNDISHEDDGRKVKMATDDSEKIPWEWQLDRDDERHLEDYYKAVDSLIRYLNAADVPEWRETDAYKESQRMLIRSGREFDDYFSIDKSERTYILLLPFIKEVQILYTKKQYGSGWDALVASGSGTDERYAACKATALLAMATAMRRMQLSVVPSAVIRRYITKNGAGSSRPATSSDIKLIADWLEEDARTWLNEMKRMRDGDEADYPLIPKNDERNKYCRL